MPILPSPDRLVTALMLCGLVIGCAVATGAVLLSPRVVLAPLPPLPALEERPDAVAAALAVQQGEALRRPLFLPSRRPASIAAAGAATSGELMPDLLITGIIVGKSGGVVTGTDKRTQKPFSLRVGDPLGEWRIDHVTRDSLRLRRRDQSRDYPLATSPQPAKVTAKP